MSNHREKQNYVITDRAEWESLWEEMFATVNPKPPLPEVDFTQRMLIALFRGTTPDPCHDISVSKVVETKGVLRVSVKEKTPGNGCVCVGSVGNAFHIIETARTEKEVEFRVKEKTVDCR